MTSDNGYLTSTGILAAASELLTEAGFMHAASISELPGFPRSSRLYEDRRSVVAVAVYDDWTSLRASWLEAQASLVEVMSGAVEATDAKAWEGYLVVVTSGPLPENGAEELARIRYDTSRLRKLSAGSEELRTVTDVERVLAPLLPLKISNLATPSSSPLDDLPSAFESHGIPRGATKAALDAFHKNEPLLQRLHEYLREQ